MAVVKIDAMGGIRPSVAPDRLEGHEAVTADNIGCRFADFRPAATDLAVASSGLTSPKTIYRFTRSGSGWNDNPATGWTVRAGEVNFVKGQIPDDANERTYYTGDGLPKATDLSGAVRQLGVPKPSAAPTLTLNVTDEFTDEERAELLSKHVALLREAVLKNVTTEWLAPAQFFGMYERAAYNGMTREEGVSVKRIAADKDGAGNYSLEDAANFAWVLDPTIDSFWFDLPGAGPSLGVPLRYGAPVKYLYSFSDTTELDQITHPLTGEPLLTSDDKESIREWVNWLLDPLNPKLIAAKDSLTVIGEQFSAVLDNDFAHAQVEAVDDFYTSVSIAGTLGSAITNLASEIAGQAAGIYHYHQANFVTPP